MEKEGGIVMGRQAGQVVGGGWPLDAIGAWIPMTSPPTIHHQCKMSSQANATHHKGGWPCHGETCIGLPRVGLSLLPIQAQVALPKTGILERTWDNTSDVHGKGVWP